MVTSRKPQNGERPAASALRAVDVTKRFGSVVANDRVNLEVRAGEIHGLLGENGAGKSTLMNIVYGLYRPDGGHIEVDGRHVDIKSPQHAVELGIGMVHQHFMLVPSMTVAENLAIGPSRAPGLSHLDDVSARIAALAQQFGLQVDPDARIEDLSLGVQQRVEIVKMLYRGADLLILDEASAALTPTEWQELAVFLRSLAGGGTSVILITHKLDELVGVADRCTVLRDGATVGTVAMEETDKASLARMMVGRPVTLRFERPLVEPGTPVLEARGLTVVEDGRTLLDDVTFTLREGEVLGVAGVAGNGQSELVDALVGLRPATGGEILLEGASLAGAGPTAFLRHGGSVIPEDRHRAGVALPLSVRDNLLCKQFADRPFARRGILDRNAARAHCARLVTEYDIKGAADLGMPISRMSGGNQQKIVLARELSRRPKLLIAAQPTRGLDIGAMEFVYQQLAEHKRAGGATLLLSIELDEILSLSDRVAVMLGGRFLRILDADEATPDAVGLLMGGHLGEGTSFARA